MNADDNSFIENHPRLMVAPASAISTRPFFGPAFESVTPLSRSHRPFR